MQSVQEFRSDPEAAQEIIEDLLPDPELRRSILEKLAASITQANELNPASWELSLAQSRKYVRLNVGGIAALDFRADGTTRIALQDGGSDLADDEGRGNRFPGTLKHRYKMLEGVGLYSLQSTELLSSWPALKDRHRSAVEQASHQMKQSPWAACHSPGTVQYLGQEQDLQLSDPTYTTNSEDPLTRFPDLFAEFVSSFLQTEEGQAHLAYYAGIREQGTKNFQQVLEMAQQGGDTTEAVLTKLLPYSDSDYATEKGAWLHLAPVFKGDVRDKMKLVVTDAGQWPEIARGLLDFIRACYEDPTQLRHLCEDFARLPISKGFQAGSLSPILNALRPDEFLLINQKPRRVINWLAQTNWSQSISDYPEANSAGHELLENLSETMLEISKSTAAPGDLFDEFCHWLVAIKKFGFNGKQKTTPTRYWKIAPGSSARFWDECVKGSFIGLSWEELGDVSGLSVRQFKSRIKAVQQEHPDWTQAAMGQVWKFRTIKPGDRVIANRGTKEIVGVGTVTSEYYFVPDEEYGHRVNVAWDSTTPVEINEGGWRKTLIELDEEKFNRLWPPKTGAFTTRTFELLAGLHQSPTKAFYSEHKDEFREHIEDPVQTLLAEVAQLLPPSITSVMETSKNVFARIPKNDYGRGGAWDFYWGAFYPKGGRRISDAQLFVFLGRDRLDYGFYIGEHGSESRNRFLKNCRENRPFLLEALSDALSEASLIFGDQENREEGEFTDELRAKTPDWRSWLRDPAAVGIRAGSVLSSEQCLSTDRKELVERVQQSFRGLFPLALLASLDDPVPEIEKYLDIEPVVEINPEYPLETCADKTGFELDTLERWVRAIRRKGQAVLYGPPGTGKTFIAEKLAAHLIGGGSGFSDLIQFHPAYAYEDFMQGIRPVPTEDGSSTTYPIVPGRFLEFCRKAGRAKDPCVLIIDEINRANLARVFGELMYLLEYRKKTAPLAGGGSLTIPGNVYVIGTMNTADRSIALVDHALRRRFAFLKLEPKPEVLRSYHERRKTGFDTSKLVSVLGEVNAAIADPNYSVGITFFLREDLDAQIEDIWRMEIEPYLDEFFLGQASKVDSFRWDKVAKNLGL